MRDAEDRNGGAVIPTEELPFNLADLPRGPGHSGSNIRVVAQCSRCMVERGRFYDPMRYEIGNGGNLECPACGTIEMARVDWREIGQDLWKRPKHQCALPGCSGEPLFQVVFVGTIEGTPTTPVYVCEDHKDVVAVQPLEGDE